MICKYDNSDDEDSFEVYPQGKTKKITYRKNEMSFNTKERKKKSKEYFFEPG